MIIIIVNVQIVCQIESNINIEKLLTNLRSKFGNV